MSLKDKVKLINLIQATWSEIYALEVQRDAEIEMIVAKAKLNALNAEWRKRFPGEKVPVFGSPNPFEVQRLQDQVKARPTTTAGAFTPRRDTYVSPFKAPAADPAATAPPPAAPAPARAVSTTALTTGNAFAPRRDTYISPFKRQSSAFDPAPAPDPAAAPPPAAPRRSRRMITDPNNPFRQIPDPNDTDEEEPDEEYH